jgi:hypothetical protein
MPDSKDSPTPSIPLSQVLLEEYNKIHTDQPAASFPDDAREPERLRHIYRLIHALPRKRSALCISGGGIRSATFALGIIQGLARAGVLDKFDYLSTVSGGGYIGGWLTGWAHRHGLDHVVKELTSPPKSPVQPEPKPVNRLRDYSNYLNPKLGLLSADTWTLAATVVRNLILNWLVLMPLLAAALMVPRIGIPIIQMNSPGRASVPGWMAWASLAAGCVSLLWAIGYIGLSRPSAGVIRGDQGSFIRFCLFPMTLSSILLVTYWAWAGHNQEWGSMMSLNLAGVSFSIKNDLLTFAAIGVLINVLAYLPGFSFNPRKVSLKTLWETIVVVLTGALGGSLVWCVATRVFPMPHENPLLYVCFASPLILLSFILAEIIFAGLSSYWTDDHDREWWARSTAWVMIFVVAWVAASGLLIFGPMGLLELSAELQAVVASAGGLAGVITILLGRSSKSYSQQSNEGKEPDAEKGGGGLTKYALAVAAPLFAVFLIVMVALGAEVLFSRNVPRTPGDYRRQILNADVSDFLLFVIALALVGLALGVFININKFSLHAMYRNRLIRAYLGASREKRKPNLFTGFDDADNIQMRQLWPNALPPHEGPPRQPFHVVNMTLNLVGGQKLAWQQRKAESFTASPLHAGCYCDDVGYRKTEYSTAGGKVFYGGKQGISLGTAVAISGAAASPNMGYHSSPVITFLMTLFNARLGWWLGNTSPAGEKTFMLAGPWLAPKPLVHEALGLTDDKNKYIYLSDGGHFENLALYEMVLRRCRIIVLSDAGQDGDFKFQDLGNAIRKIRIDFGVPIEFPFGVKMYSRGQATKGDYVAVGTIGYSCVDEAETDGVLIYIKPAFYGDEPRDVYQYAQTHPAFPHDTTADQWFDESQFESYRMLGRHIISLISGDDKKAGEPADDNSVKGYDYEDTSLEEFVKKVYDHLKLPVEQ